MRVLVLGAGGPAGVNTCKALSRAGYEVVAADANERHLQWCSGARVHMPEVTVDAVNMLRADVVFAQPDSLVNWLSVFRDEIEAATFLPGRRSVIVCQNKFATADEWFRQGLRDDGPVSVREPWPDYLHIARDQLGSPFWLRATKGAGATGAILVHELGEAYHWIRFWQTRGVKHRWMAQAYLSGRDLAWSSIWYRGELVTSFLRERIEYLYPHLTPEGLTGTPTVARIVHDFAANEVARDAVLAIDLAPHGIFSVDLREDEDGVPRPTEINAGRGFTTFGLWSTFGRNFMHHAARLAVGSPADPTLPRWNALPEGLTLSRHIDCPAVFAQDRGAVRAVA